MLLQVPDWIRPFVGKDLVWRMPQVPKQIYLTFDDGPVPEVTPWVLDVLECFGWKATFFCVGENVQRHPGLYQRLIQEGHRIGNHTFNHVKGQKLTVEAYYAIVLKAGELMDSKLFRPPHGRISKRQINRLRTEYQIIMWDILTYDYDASTEASDILKMIRRKSRPGSIVVFHDSLKAQKNLKEVLPKALEYWTAEGYSFGLL